MYTEILFLMIGVSILLLQVFISKKHHLKFGMNVSLLGHLVSVAFLSLIQVSQYNEIENSAPLYLFLLPIFLYTLSLITVDYLFYHHFKNKLI